MAVSTFNGINFNWTFGNPPKERKDNVNHYAGEIVCYSQADFDALFVLQRPVTVRAVGSEDAFVDYWPPDPSHILVMYTGQPNQETHTAILLSFRRATKLPGFATTDLTALPDGTIHQGQADFLLLS